MAKPECNDATAELRRNAARYRAVLDTLVFQAIGQKGTRHADLETAARLSYALLRLSGRATKEIGGGAL